MDPKDYPEGSKQDKNGIWRNAKGHILPGQVANPNGAKRTPAQKEIQELARSFAPTCLEKLFEIATEGNRDADRIKASEIILDRAYGKPKTQSESDGGTYVPQPIIIGDISKLQQQDEIITDSGETLDTEE